MSSTDKSNSKLLLQYSGLAIQLLVLIGITLWTGIKTDKWFKFSFPLLTWLLPLIAFIALMLKITKDTSNKRK
jgi:hypothetical protein